MVSHTLMINLITFSRIFSQKYFLKNIFSKILSQKYFLPSSRILIKRKGNCDRERSETFLKQKVSKNLLDSSFTIQNLNFKSPHFPPWGAMEKRTKNFSTKTSYTLNSSK
jgi:hypothetical protein